MVLLCKGNLLGWGWLPSWLGCQPSLLGKATRQSWGGDDHKEKREGEKYLKTS